ncbi:molybdopterin molybdotransferase MoeA [Methylocystis sp. MJC1]|jgi:molybdopterin molybdotransferase|uniref:molybdopterin molybdotransferase MoeA n=1 Tax=Methylocystis sp. MJC1 TaxID=2654282 RepID=UPI0013ED619F|nr:gephyrin-like molybdotransferase Glp [Methylocystis sp. MJC1]KAF2989218.1 Molybdopterin molybdenumtransferase [Methylocystis sp. MJC1]MBU6526945.1 molybdopterin molybdotransferase MoeA [Methylocystis sp. MJC1]UZX13381.1 molybdopterin molybdotransferase MoeA [Methylocystis sp. MJC1]
MADNKLLSVDDALARILSGAALLGEEETPLAAARGRTLARDLVAKRTQPPVDVSAMDGYALRSADLAAGPLKLVGESAAGHGYAAALNPGETVRIFTGAPVPAGSDAILLQEDAEVAEGGIRAKSGAAPGNHIRVAGLDFRAGAAGLFVGTRLGPAELALAAAMNHAILPVARRPRVALLASGDELVPPGAEPGPAQIIACNSFAVGAIAEGTGAEVIDLGLFRDDLADLERGIGLARAAKADILVTLGGASVGDHDLLRPALARQGMTLDFWKIAMRPGKPLISGRLGDAHILGLPGNPVASIVCALVFLAPLIRALQGDPKAGADQTETAIAGANLPANKGRRDYMRARLSRDAEGHPVATPQPMQDSSLLTELAQSQALLIREPGDAPLPAGAPCRIWRLPG